MIDEDNFIKLGMAVLNTKKGGWETLNNYVQRKLLYNQRHHKQCTFGQFCHSKQKIGQQCQISMKSDQQFTWKNQYYLHIPDPTSDYVHDINQYDNSNNSKQANLNTTILISSSSVTMTNLLNLFQRKDIKICRPRSLKASSERQTFINSHGNQQIFYISNYDTAFCFKIALQLWVREGFLIQMTRNYEKYQKSIKNSSDQDDNRWIMSRLDEQIQLKSSRFIEQQFINILNLIVKQSSLEIQEEVKHEQKILDLPLDGQNQIQQCQSSSIKPFISQNSKLKTQSTVIPFNFENDAEAGLFFDLDSNSVIESPTPPGFIGELKNYQSRALTWLLFRQGKSENACMDMTHVPFWTVTSDNLDLKQKLLINTHLNFVVWKRNIEKNCNGGILADEMGLGKTVMMIALILANRPSNNCQTLIIAPLSVVKQWKNQLKLFAPSLRVLVLNQQKINKTNLRSADIVITSQGKLRAELTSDKVDGLLDNSWYRVIIDEAHNFKNSATAMAKSIFRLNAQYRWCLTGTPTQNCITDLFSLIKFLKFAPWCEATWWRAAFPKDVRNTTSQHFMKVKAILKGILLRRKKQSVDANGQNLIVLPKVDVKVHIVKLSEQAKQLYQKVDFEAKIALNSLQKLQQIIKSRRWGRRQKKNMNLRKKIQYNYVLTKMIKLRMLSCHEFLFTYKSQYRTKETFITDYLKFIAKTKIKRKPKRNFFDYLFANPEQKQNFNKATSFMNEVYENWDERIHDICTNAQKMKCLMCNERDDCVLTPCLHIFCQNCVQNLIKEKWISHNQKQGQLDPQFKQQKLHVFVSECPQCGDRLRKCELFDLPRINQFNRSYDQFKYNQKLNSLAMYIKNMKSSDKALVFTYFLGMMKLVARMLTEMNITYLTLQGSDSLETRHSKITEFNKNRRITVMILTLKIGSVGLNMQAANKVFFMDPWWNPAIQEQAIARVHRIGQTKQVQAVKFITQSTIEARILKLSVIKKQMCDSILDIDDVKNNTKYSKKRSEMKFLLSVQQDFDDQDSENQDQSQNGKDELEKQQQFKSQLQFINKLWNSNQKNCQNSI